MKLVCVNIPISTYLADGTPRGYVINWSDWPSWAKPASGPAKIRKCMLSYLATLNDNSDGVFGMYLDVGKEYLTGCGGTYPVANQTGPTIKLSPLGIIYTRKGYKPIDQFYFPRPVEFSENDCLIVDFGGTGDMTIQPIWDLWVEM